MTTAPLDDTAMTPPAPRDPAPSWLQRRWMGLAAAAALLAAMGSVVGLSSAATIYGQETASLADQATAQDLVNLLLIAPLVLVLGWWAHRGHLPAYFGWLGCVTFTVYNYAIYAFSVQFGPLFLVWIGVLGLSIFALIGSLATVDTSAIKACFAGRPLRWPGWFLIGAAALFTLLWLSQILPDLLAQRPSRSASELNVPTNPVHVLDLAFFLPAAATTGVLVLRRHRWGYATVAGQLTWVALTCLPIMVTPLVADARGHQPGWAVIVPIGVMLLVAGTTLGWVLRAARPGDPLTPTRQRALSHVLGIIAGTSLLGVVLPAVLIGALDPFPIWLGYAVLAVAAATIVAWRWSALASGKGSPSLVITSCVLLMVLAMAGVAVT